MRVTLSMFGLAAALLPASGLAAPLEGPPTPKHWQALAALPDWSGIWNPDIPDQNAQIKSNPVPWSPAAAKQAAALDAQERAGNPKGIFVDCLPEAMPSWMLISHNAMEILFTPGRVTMLGESDGNRLRRIYTDGRPHPEDPDLTFHGHSIGTWEGDTLVVDTIGIVPQAFLAISEAIGIPNNGDLHVVERIRLSPTNKDLLEDELTITAPKILTKPWVTKRLFHRFRGPRFDIVEGNCLQGSFTEEVDANGNAVFRRVNLDENGNAIPIAEPVSGAAAPKE